jgi:hypothetical protein
LRYRRPVLQRPLAKKAAKYGIHLRDFATLTPEEIQNWGRKRTLRISFCEFTQVALTLRMKEHRESETPKLTNSEGGPVNPVLWYELFEQVMHQLDKQNWTGVPATITVGVGFELLVNGKRPASITFRQRCAASPKWFHSHLWSNMPIR